MIIRTVKSSSKNYFAINKDIFKENLSLGAIGLYCYLQTNGGEVNISSLNKVFPDYQEWDFERWFDELERNGWTTTSEKQREEGS